MTTARTLTTSSSPARLAPALARVTSLGLVLAGCPACRLPLGVDGAPGLADALAAHQHDCPKRHSAPAPARPADDVCPDCGCEAELYPRASGWRCGDCLAEVLLADPAMPATRRPARQPAPTPPGPDAQVLAHTPRRQPRQQQRRRRPAQRAVVA